MFRCLLGERRSGKSLFVENKIKGIDENALYIATLPEFAMYHKIIEIHKKRRPSTWECVEFFQMSVEEILKYPYNNYQNVILDNLSYYVLFHLYYYKDDFLNKCDEKIFSLIDSIGTDNNTIVHFVDTPIHQDVLETDDKNGIIRQLFTGILDKAVVIERYYSGEMVCPMTIEEGKEYLFHG